MFFALWLVSMVWCVGMASCVGFFLIGFDLLCCDLCCRLLGLVSLLLWVVLGYYLFLFGFRFLFMSVSTCMGMV